MAWLRKLLCVCVIAMGCSDNGGMSGPNLHLPDGGGLCGQTMCTSSQACCAGMCLSTLSDVNNCGSCGNSCPQSRSDSCQAGHCKCGGSDECASDHACCGGACIDVQNDNANCGMCGHACGQNERCSSGSCVSTLCAGAPCDFLCCGGTTCADISRDPMNCGQCNKVCNTANGETCQPQGGGLGMCVVICGGTMCMMGQGCCGSTCTDVQFDDFNCGSCGNVCDTSSGNVFCFNGCCFDFTTNQCLPNGDGGVPDGGFPFPDGGFPFPDAFPFPDGFPFPFDAGSAPG